VTLVEVPPKFMTFRVPRFAWAGEQPPGSVFEGPAIGFTGLRLSWASMFDLEQPRLRNGLLTAMRIM
jgi:hypothetical protein